MAKNYKKETLLVLIIGMLATTITEVQCQALLSPNSQQKFINALPIPSVIQPTTPNGSHYEVSMTQFTQDLGLKDSYGNPMLTTVWGYNGSYPGPTFEVRKNIPITVRWKNELRNGSDFLPHLLPVDTSIHWSMPESWPYSGVPLVTHLHGGHVQSASDGNPNAWFTPGFTQKGSYWSQQIYNYPNDQEAATIWYHDHALGITRLNVYAGLAGYYIVRDEWEDNLNLPSGNYEIPIAIQDRMFTEDGQLFYPSMPEEAGQPNPSILPEMFGDFILVNGKTWPILNVEPRKYRFRFLNGSDSRFYKLYFGNAIPFVQIGTDGGFLNAPVALNQMTLGPGERKDVIVDFSNPELSGQTIILRNNARAPFPMGETVNPQTAGQIMAFRVTVPLNGTDNSVIPTTLRQYPITVLGAPDKTRQLLLVETEDDYGRLKPQLGTSALGALNWDQPITENPMLDAIEEWEVINYTEDAHPIHLHLVNFQIISRHKFNISRYVMGSPNSLQLLGQPKLPTTDESGWKDTAVMYPGEVTRIRAKFDTEGLYLWHCHILSHEDHEMMRPFYVGPMPSNLTVQKNNGTFDATIAPNPFSNQTVVKMEAGISGKYKAEIYDILGQHISTIADAYYEKGTYDLSWNGTRIGNSKVGNGIYFLHIQGVDGNRTYKILLER
jgi:spore coat protein A